MWLSVLSVFLQEDKCIPLYRTLFSVLVEEYKWILCLCLQQFWSPYTGVFLKQEEFYACVCVTIRSVPAHVPAGCQCVLWSSDTDSNTDGRTFVLPSLSCAALFFLTWFAHNRKLADTFSDVLPGSNAEEETDFFLRLFFFYARTVGSQSRFHFRTHLLVLDRNCFEELFSSFFVLFFALTNILCFVLCVDEHSLFCSLSCQSHCVAAFLLRCSVCCLSLGLFPFPAGAVSSHAKSNVQFRRKKKFQAKYFLTMLFAYRSFFCRSCSYVVWSELEETCLVSQLVCMLLHTRHVSNFSFRWNVKVNRRYSVGIWKRVQLLHTNMDNCGIFNQISLTGKNASESDLKRWYNWL